MKKNIISLFLLFITLVSCNPINDSSKELTSISFHHDILQQSYTPKTLLVGEDEYYRYDYAIYSEYKTKAYDENEYKEKEKKYKTCFDCDCDWVGYLINTNDYETFKEKANKKYPDVVIAISDEYMQESEYQCDYEFDIVYSAVKESSEPKFKYHLFVYDFFHNVPYILSSKIDEIKENIICKGEKQ